MYFKETLDNLRQIAEHMKTIAAHPKPPAQSAPGSAARLDPHDVVAALAEGLKSDNAETQAASRRLTDLATKYNSRAY